MRSGQRLRCILHRFNIEALRDVGVRFPLEDVHHSGVPDVVRVRLRFRGKAAMEIVRHFFDARDADVVRQQIVHAEDQTARRNRKRRVEVRALCERVHARVGASRAFDANRLVEQLRQRLFDERLHADRVRLRLPAGVARAEVLEGEEEAHRLLYPERQRGISGGAATERADHRCASNDPSLRSG